jgi:hypothetical protein
MPKGQKICPNCQKINGCRSFVCSNCNHVFAIKKDTMISAKEKRTHVSVKNFDWRSLEHGDKIKITNGPYFLTKEGELIPMGYKGKFTVEKIDETGILAWSMGKHSGIAYIYMGPETLNKETGITKVSHKILKLKRIEHVENKRQLS